MVCWWVLDPGFILVMGGVAAIFLSVELNAKFREKSLNLWGLKQSIIGSFD
jgi:predicted membrane metal-binding protein